MALSKFQLRHRLPQEAQLHQLLLSKDDMKDNGIDGETVAEETLWSTHHPIVADSPGLLPCMLAFMHIGIPIWLTYAATVPQELL